MKELQLNLVHVIDMHNKFNYEEAKLWVSEKQQAEGKAQWILSKEKQYIPTNRAFLIPVSCSC